MKKRILLGARTFYGYGCLAPGMRTDRGTRLNRPSGRSIVPYSTNASDLICYVRVELNVLKGVG
jgi:hypothetical protein